MAFVIYAKNEGETATVRIEQWINDNEPEILHEAIIEVDGTVEINARRTDDDGDERGRFRWTYVVTGFTGDEVVRAGDTMRMG